MIIILKNNHLDTDRVLIMNRQTGKYGMYFMPSGTVIVEPKYDYIYPFEEGVDRTIVKDDGYVYQIDRAGQEFFDNYMSIEDYEGDIGVIDKAPTCPKCAGAGCSTCSGFGFILPFDEWVD